MIPRIFKFIEFYKYVEYVTKIFLDCACNSHRVSKGYAILKMSRKYEYLHFSSKITRVMKLRKVNRDLSEWEYPLDWDLRILYKDAGDSLNNRSRISFIF